MLNARLAPHLSTPLETLTQAGACYGVAIDVEVCDDAALYTVSLLRPRGALRVAVTAEETAARRLWSLLARLLRRPRFVARPDGGFRAIDQMLGAIVGRDAEPRRPRRVALRRRPMSRRHKALQHPPVAHAGEREIICYE